jgi:hypothetical protein
MKNYILLISFIHFTQFIHTQTLFVNQQASGIQDGSSWANAFVSVRQALAVAQVGDQIWVASGIYTPTEDSNRSISFELRNGVRMYGGFKGTETTIEQRNISENSTILSGEIGDPSSRTDNALHVLYGYGLNDATLVDGFTIANGYANGSDNLLDGNGGGMLLQPGDLPDSRPVFRNCTFESNFADYNGGGIALDWGGANAVNPVFDHCTFLRNHALYGAALYKAGPSSPDAAFMIQSCDFIENRALLGGGGLFFNKPGTNTLIKNSKFEFDSTGGGGGAMYYFVAANDSFGCKLKIDSCIFNNNLASEGGCINIPDMQSISKTIPFQLDITACVFDKNKAKNSDAGVLFVSQFYKSRMNINIIDCEVKNNSTFSQGALRVTGLGGTSRCDIIMKNCSLINNKDFNFNNSSCFAALFSGSFEMNVQVDNCLFAKNGDGIAVVTQPLGKAITHITNCSFVNNRKIPVSKSWYSTYNGVTDYNKCYITNCIFWEPETIIYYMFFNNDFNNITIYDYHIDYSVLSIASEIGVPGYFEALGSHIKWKTYPEFADTTNYDFRLKPCSPAVNIGNNFIVDSLGLFTDLDGLPRMQFGKVDAGAFESQDSCLEVGLAQPLSVSNTLSVAPNPSTGILHLDLGQQITGDLRLEIYDYTGALVYQNLRFNTLSPTLDLSSLPPGLYLIKASCLQERYTTKWLRMN